MFLLVGILFVVIVGLALYLSSLVGNLPDEYFSAKPEPVKTPRLSIQSIKIPCFYKGYDLEVKAQAIDKEILLNFRLQNANDKESLIVFNRQISPAADRSLYIEIVDLLSKIHPADKIYVPRKVNDNCVTTDVLMYKTNDPETDALPDSVYANVTKGDYVFDWFYKFIAREKEFVDAMILSKTRPSDADVEKENP